MLYYINTMWLYNRALAVEADDEQEALRKTNSEETLNALRPNCAFGDCVNYGEATICRTITEGELKNDPTIKLVIRKPLTARERFEKAVKVYKDLGKEKAERDKDDCAYSTSEHEAYDGLDDILELIKLAEEALAEAENK